ncbi:hypothetical protein BcepF1.029 [Burkholderia phage BcepF1]|uniref:Uncharacterized protein n=1 Tax=Burkholderia phage BcepF1 TaxID=2886897 RepID=A1YZT3_9CAUD|nr:hypothetical protein BcepF1.029 [Burkholderia phage BcepF1]ABL96760.1 hypothetical protein BcepF1.029 [Burkholderia phage BcepF1]
MTFQFLARDDFGRTKALTKEQFELASTMIVDLVNGRVSPSKANKSILRLLENAGIPVKFGEETT